MDTLLKDLRDTSRYMRRRRGGPPQSDKVGDTTINSRDAAILAFIHLYGGMLTTDIIYKYANISGIYKSRASLSRRLKELYHETGLIERPKQQRQIEYPDRFNLVHRVSEKGEAFLKSRHLFSEFAPRPFGAYAHQMMTACLYASYYLSACEAGLEFVPQHVILEKSGGNSSILIDGKCVVPDALFMIAIEGKQVLIFLEADRSTEPGHSTDDKRKSWGKSVEHYRIIIGQKLYKEHFNVPASCGAQVHAVTIHYTMQQKILRQIQRVFPDGCHFFLVHTSIAFGETSHPPKYMDMFKISWDRSGHSVFQFLK